VTVTESHPLTRGDRDCHQTLRVHHGMHTQPLRPKKKNLMRVSVGSLILNFKMRAQTGHILMSTRPANPKPHLKCFMIFNFAQPPPNGCCCIAVLNRNKERPAAKMAVNLQKLLELMDAKDKKNLEDLGGVVGLAQNLGSDIQGGLKGTSEQDLHNRRQQYGENKMERKPPPTITELFLEAMQDTTIIILLVAAGSARGRILIRYFCGQSEYNRIDFLCSAVSITVGVIICLVHLGTSCKRKPLWDVGKSNAAAVNSISPIESFDFPILTRQQT
jgi:hypothetical protein